MDKSCNLYSSAFFTTEFRDSISDARVEYQGLKKTKSNLALQKKDAELIQKAFGNIYPMLAYELSKLIDGLPRYTELFKQNLEEMREKWRLQDKCQHVFCRPTNTIEGYGRQCKKCHYVESLKSSMGK